MDEKVIKKCLVEICDHRLRALIGYKQPSFSGEIVDYMFRNFRRLSHHGNSGYQDVIKKYLRDILIFVPGSEQGSESAASYSTIQLLLTLENYIRSNVELFCPDWRMKYQEKEYRRVLGNEFEKVFNDHPERFPSGLYPRNFLPQLNQTTVFRNKFAHNETFGKSSIFPRYVILLAYDVLVSYLLYTFYCMALTPCQPSEDPLKHIND